MIQPAEPNRRAYGRITPPKPLRAAVGSGDMGLVEAMVEDISRGGVRLAIDESRIDLREDQCIVRFDGSADEVSPLTSRGWIRRTMRADDTFLLAIEFTEPLVALQLDSA